jgi:hypothetical protein
LTKMIINRKYRVLNKASRGTGFLFFDLI